MKRQEHSSTDNHYGYLIYLLSISGALLLTILFTTQCRAQTNLYNDAGKLYTTKGAVLHIEGNLQNKDTATIQNDGVIELTGNLVNDSIARMVNAGDTGLAERAYKFIGTDKQIISGNLSNSANRYIYNLIIDKKASGSVVELQAGAEVKGSLIFGSGTGAATYTPTQSSTLTNNAGQGIIKTYSDSNRDYELYVTNPAVRAVAGYAPLVINGNPTDGFIQTRGAQGIGEGGFSRNVNTLGMPYVFPLASSLNGYNATAVTFHRLGTDTDKVRGMFVDAEGGIGTISSSCVGCNGSPPGNNGFNYYFDNNPCNGGTPKWVILDALAVDHGYWSFSGHDSDSYVIEAFPNSFSTLEGSGIDDWRMIKKSGEMAAIPSGDWNPEIATSVDDVTDLLTYNKNGGCYTGNGVPGGVYKGFAHFQMARSKNGNALPIELGYITANAIENRFIRLNWSTLLELNNSGFKVMRSVNGVDFDAIGWVDTKTEGNSTVEVQYVYDDLTAEANTVYYYKLIQVDFDGHSEETPMVIASLTGNSTLAVSEFFPNPAQNFTGLMINTTADVKFQVELYSLTGQLMLENEISAGKGSAHFTFSTDMLPTGNYRVLLRNGQQNITRNLNITK